MASRALLVVDMQNGFLDPTGSVRSTGLALEDADIAVENTQAAVEAARAVGTPVVWTRQVFRPGYVDAGRHLAPAIAPFRPVNGLLLGSWDADTYGPLGRRDDDPVIDKPRYDAFYNTPLEQILRGLDVDELVVAGIITNACVETTVRSALVRDYAVTLLHDCCAAVWRKYHQMSVDTMRAYHFATVTSMHEGFRFSGPDRAALPHSETEMVMH